MMTKEREKEMIRTEEGTDDGRITEAKGVSRGYNALTAALFLVIASCQTASLRDMILALLLRGSYPAPSFFRAPSHYVYLVWCSYILFLWTRMNPPQKPDPHSIRASLG